MTKKFEIYFLIFATTVPFFNFYRFSPAPDWFTNAGVVFFVSVFVIVSALRGAPIKWSVSPGGLFLLAGGVFWVFRAQYFDAAYMALILFLLMMVCFCIRNYDLKEVVKCIAEVVLICAMIQAFLGGLQAADVAKYFDGYIVFDSARSVVGNIAQRNQYANFLGWGLISVSYLYAHRSLNTGISIVLAVFFALMMCWSGSRLALLYGLALVCLAWLWLKTSSDAEVMRRMALALALAVLALAIIQIFNHDILLALKRIGLDFQTVSGSERILDGDVGARRKIEWTKAWDVFLEHPWMGVGVGGFAAKSVAMEVASGLPKAPESWLYAHCHNLIFQMLAEVGVLGTGMIVSGLVVTIKSYFKRCNRTIENFFLLSLAGVILIHSMFEYPLWYLPFLFMLAIVGAAAPEKKVFILDIRPSIVRGISIFFGAIGVWYCVVGVSNFWMLVRYSAPSADFKENLIRIESLSSLAKNPFWVSSADMMLGNYLLPTKEQLNFKLMHFEKLASFQPYASVLTQLSILRALNAQPDSARKALYMVIANYPESVPRLAVILSSRAEPEIKPLREIVIRAAQAYAQHPPHSQAAQLAAVMTVAAPVTRKTLF
ncbi:O-antigen ligase C-terminal domain-containing protein [Chromobacterium haemolyticum]|uniref:O-antigen ligase C-terminal domain-containing protein n=1 Tax=Chromobacterium haemolyticum TaxID=394935 RepID=A0ABS3GMK5_9NEIS|nr:O-antigen ligase family protein [Chromobacterium haemolyticum]MBK0414853.1 O-antigen ligase C-terminal domain-containing protein [Chromobacterium haemolyticum]MBO0416232.1 O-antigen ligase C-terminal domain-containing protein [Chromobacterium haemolyticum]MBO0499269.1 O-antigen ligase C-terminal domain-containing protein [Chromobacterium haemolyticum]BBH11107.1 hypothetical protein CH06BL_03550 [Chromobacterium haemolyticum]